MDPLVSILIPCYNAERWIGDALKSVQAQTWKNTEVVLVDDGSKDGSVAVAESLAWLKLKIIRQDNQGAAAARNRAWREAQGDFIQWFDADDLLGPEKIERQIRLLEKAPPGMIASGEWARFWKAPEEARFIPEVLWKDMSPVQFLISAWTTNSMMQPGAWLVPRAVTERAGPWNATLLMSDDSEYFGRVILASEGIRFCPGAKVYYRSGNPTSLTSQHARRDMERWVESVDLMTRTLLSKENSPETRQAAACLYRQFVFFVFLDQGMQDLVEKAEKRVDELGGADIRPGGGKMFQGLVSLLGWKQAMRLRNRWHHA